MALALVRYRITVTGSLANLGLGTAPTTVGLPDEQIGYMASEEYAHRITSSRPVSSYQNKAHSNSSQTHVESPLRKASFPVDAMDKSALDGARGNQGSSEHALEDETEDDVIHIDAPAYRTSKFSGNGYDPPTVDLGPYGGNTDAEGGYIEERGRGTPILASDEATPGAEYMQPAVPPAQERPGSGYHDSEFGRHNRHGSRSGSASNSRPTSRPGSIHGQPPGLSRFLSHEEHDLHTPLEDVEEYEPLFLEEEKLASKPQTQADRMKHRPDMKRRFPSQDIWEDTPHSLQLETEVDSPEPVHQQTMESTAKKAGGFEPPEAEAARKGEVSEREKEDLLSKEERLSKSNFKPHLRQEMKRPSVAQRFPSQDIWEDSPDSARLEATVGDEEDNDDAGLIAGAVVSTSGRPDQSTTEQHREGATDGSSAVPVIPPRPAKAKHAEGMTEVPTIHPQVHQRPLRNKVTSPHEPSHLSEVFTAPSETKETSPIEGRKGPMVPDRPKPHVPARPTKSLSRDSAERVVSPVGSTTEPDVTKSNVASPPPINKAKPTVPARPAGSKIAALQAGFMSDLNNRLKLGPHAPPKIEEKNTEEKEEEKTPLSDARKGRARGPARRKPAASPSAAAEPTQAFSPKFSIVEPFTVWRITKDGILDVVHASRELQKLAQAETAGSTAQHSNTAVESNTGEEAEQDPNIMTPSEDEMQTTPSSGLEPNSATLDATSEDITTSSLPKDDIPIKPDSIEEPSDMTDSSAQTGETIITTNTNSEQPEKIRIIEGGDARHGETVIIKEGVDMPEDA